MHADGRIHGGVDVAHVVIRGSGAALVEAERRRLPDFLMDLTGFGAVLYAMLTGKQPAGDEFRVVPAKPPILKGPAAVRATATRLAERCLTAERDTAPDFQKILTEVRLLSVMAKQFSTEQLGAHIPLPPPIMFPAPQPLEVFAGTAAPVINPPAIQPTSKADANAAAAAASMVPREDSKPGAHSPKTLRAKTSHSRPVLQDVMCPKCKGYHVRLSRPRTRFERLLNLVGIGVHRCHRCFYRYIPVFGRKIVRKSH